MKKISDWLQHPVKKQAAKLPSPPNGASCLTRTGDTLINSQVL